MNFSSSTAPVHVDQLRLVDADVRYVANFFAVQEADQLLQRLIDEVPWQQHYVKMFGRSIASPRLSSWHGDPHAYYRYSGTRHAPSAWTNTLSELRASLANGGIGDFNCVLANYYRDCSDSMGWHSDDEPELGAHPTIASLSFGATRRFDLRHKSSKQKASFELQHGSLLIMRGTTQECWEHALPKQKKAGDLLSGLEQSRVNLTFRYIRSPR